VYGHKTQVFEVFLNSSVQGQKSTGSHSLESVKHLSPLLMRLFNVMRVAELVMWLFVAASTMTFDIRCILSSSTKVSRRSSKYGEQLEVNSTMC
jgi:hypothetical protein